MRRESERESEVDEEDMFLPFGISRHRAWVVGMYYWMIAGISWEASRGPLGGSFEASWGPFWGICWASWGPLGASWGLLES